MTTDDTVCSTAMPVGVRSRATTGAHLARLYARVALGSAFLSSVAARFGWWGARSSWRGFADFTRYTAEVTAFLPAWTAPFFAWAATIAELALGLTLVAGFRTRWSARASAVLLALFASAMTVSAGVKAPLDYSVFTASACALLLALHEPATR